MTTLRGTRVTRKEDAALLTGQGLFVADRQLDGAVWAAYVVSPIAHGRILSIDTAEAAAVPGVLDVVTAADVATDLPSTTYPPFNPGFDPAMVRPFLAQDRVRFVGETVAVVVAEDLATATDAAELVFVDYEPLPAVADPDLSAETDIRLFDGSAEANVAIRMDAELDTDFAACDVVVELRVVNNRLAVCPIETRIASAEWADDGRLVHYNAGQGVHPVRAILAGINGLEKDQVRVVCADVGGSFGAKGRPHPEEALLGMLSRRVGRPVQWTPARTNDMVGLSHGRAQVQYISIGGDRDGTIKAYKVHARQDAGAYPMGGAGLPNNVRVMLTGCYEIESAGFTAESVVTNTTPTGAYRGAGRPEAAAAIERAVDRFAAEIGMDPAEVRRKNFLEPDAFPLKTNTGTPYDSGRYEKALDMALEASGYADLRAEQQRRREAGETKLLGIGLSTYVERTAGLMGSEYGSIRMRADGTALVLTGSSPYGQGHYTAWSMLVSERTGIPMDKIEVAHGDTDLVPRGGITGGSRSVQIAGMAIWEASAMLVQQARDLAANLLEANPDDVVLDADQGRFHVAGTPAVFVDWDALAETLAEEPSEIDAAEGEGKHSLYAMTDYEAKGPTFPFGAHIAVVEVDAETGHTELQRIVAVDDAGVILNPLLADGQVHGGLAQGAAQALLEEFIYDEAGNPLTSNFADYAMISAAELPMFERIVLETPTPHNELGAKGIGESGTVGATPAVQNAVIDAVAHLGVTHIDMPCTPERVWSAMNQASSAR